MLYRRSTQRSRPLAFPLIFAVAGVCGLLPAATRAATTVNWTDGTGNWSTAANWTNASSGHTVPAAGDTVNITETDGVNRIITYDYTGAAITLGTLTLNLTNYSGAATIALSMAASTLTVNGFEYIGFSGTGNFNQSGGTNTINSGYALYTGYSSGSTGTYTLSGTGALVANGNEDVGLSGTGIFNQSGGTNTINSGNALYLGVNTGSSGTYTLSGTGALSVTGYEYIGSFGTGNFNQSGGTNTINSGYSLYLGVNGGSSGTYALSGTGSLSVTGFEYIGSFGTGNFNQSGGTNTINSGYALYTGYSSGSTGTYTLSGTGALVANGNEDVGLSGTGNFNQSGGTNTINSGNTLYLGVNTGSGGTYTLSGTGALSVTGYEYIGSFGTGNFNQSGGTNTINSGYSLHLGVNGGSSGTYALSGTGSLSVTGFEYVGFAGTGAFNQSGGTNTVSNAYLGYFNGSSGTYTLSGTGALSVNGYEFIGDAGTGTFNQSGGTNTINSGSALYLGYDSGSTGTYTLSGGSAALNGGGSVFVGGQPGGGTGILNVSGAGVLTISGTLVAYPNTVACAINLSGGTINAAGLNFNGVPTLLNWTGGTLNITANVTFDSGAAWTSTSDAFGPSLALGNNQTLMVTGNETLGGTGAFGLILNSGSSHYVTGSITLSPTGTITQNAGSSLYASTFTQAGGTVNGTLQNQGNFVYQSGQFNGRLLNQGTLNLGPSFTAGNGVENDTNMTLFAGQNLTANGAGLNNLGTFTLEGGGIAGSGPVLNNSGGNFQGYGTINPVFTNNGILTVSGVLAFTNVSPALNNGILQGSGTITGNFSNTAGGTITVAAGNSLAFASAWTNAGLVNLQAGGAVLAGGTITNGATIQGAGTINAPIANSTGVVRAQEGELDLAGAGMANSTGAQIQAATGSTLFVNQGLAINAGTIALTGGTFDNNNHPLNNTGSIEGNGSILTSGLTNDAAAVILLADAPTSVFGPVTNNGLINITANNTTFFGNVTNNGTIKVTAGVARYLGNGVSMTVGGTYDSDPSDNYFNGLATTSTGHILGGPSDRFFLTGNSNFTNAGTYTNAGTLTANDINNTGTFTQLAGTATTTGLTLNAGTLAGHGTINGPVFAGANPHTIAPSANLPSTTTGALTLASLTTNANTTLAFNLVTPNTTNGNDQLVITAPTGLTLNGGNIQIANTSTGAASLGYYKAIEYSGSIQGTGISSINLPAISHNIAYILDTSHDPGYIDIHRGFLGDANDDGIVNAIDLGILASNYNSTTANWSDGDYNGDGIVNAIDLGILASNYNAVIGANTDFQSALEAYPALEAAYSGSTSVPEPASLTLMLLCFPALLRRKKTI